MRCEMCIGLTRDLGACVSRVSFWKFGDTGNDRLDLFIHTGWNPAASPNPKCLRTKALGF